MRRKLIQTIRKKTKLLHRPGKIIKGATLNDCLTVRKGSSWHLFITSMWNLKRSELVYKKLTAESPLIQESVLDKRHIHGMHSSLEGSGQ